jgi:hypothetical protein
MTRRNAATILLRTFAAACMLAASVAHAGRMFETELTVGDSTYVAEWHLPDGDARALVTVQHGFARTCANVRGTAQRLMEDQGVATLCLNAPMVMGNPPLAEALAGVIVAGLFMPDERPVPERIVVGGHSAGAHFASRLGWSLAEQAPSRLGGAVLFDPVAGDASFDDNLSAIGARGTRPVLAITATAHPCNADHNAYNGLRRVMVEALEVGRDGFVGLELTERSTHIDAEGRDTDLLAVLSCGGRPRRGNVDALRMLSGAWALDAALDARRAEYYPGGRVVDDLIASSRAVPIR